mmetsp:Transcript_154937/g.495441  ORF Transcript_154937/g.495441 Transcript_154937/m.495441 type:complete len:283 (+) Transcript_154937:85-933(+)
MGDVAGAWLALDEDVSGSITLEEIDPDAFRSLMGFKRWAMEEFGSVRSAFKTIDTDGSNDLTLKQFRIAMREYGFQGDATVLFESFDCNGEARLQYKEVLFLDSWDLPDLIADVDVGVVQSSMEVTQEVLGSTLLAYGTDNPGPGAYDMPSLFGAGSVCQHARHGGSFSFTGRDRQQDWLRGPGEDGPARFEGPQSARGPQHPRKPAWGFGTTKSITEEILQARASTPGPGSYDTSKTSARGPGFSMGQRWGVMLHPLQRPASNRGAVHNRRVYAVPKTYAL